MVIELVEDCIDVVVDLFVDWYGGVAVVCMLECFVEVLIVVCVGLDV